MEPEMVSYFYSWLIPNMFMSPVPYQKYDTNI